LEKTEFKAINQQDIENLEWIFLSQDKLMTAQGEAIFNIYLGKVIIDNQEFEIPVFAGEEIQEILLGSQWLKLFILVANYQERKVSLEKN
jgi:predicted aspartyl protease